MNTALTEALKEAYALAPANVATLDTLEISHPSIAEPIYLVRNNVDLVLTFPNATTGVPEAHTFTAAAFKVTLPKKSDEGVQDLDLKICNADRRVSDFMEQASNFQTKVICKYRPYLSTDLTTPQYDPPLLLALSDITATIYEVSARASFADLVNRKFPNEIYSRLTFPSLGG